MNRFVLEQVAITQKDFLACKNAKGLMTQAFQFLSLTLQPQEILFCVDSDTLPCLAQQIEGLPITHSELVPTTSNNHIHHRKLWKLTRKKPRFSTHLPITHSKIRTSYHTSDHWYCLKLRMNHKPGIFVFLKNPQQESMQLWKSEPQLASLILQFLHLFQQFKISKDYKIELSKRDKQHALYLQEIEQQRQFSSKTLTLHKMTQDLIATANLDDLYKFAVESLRDVLGFDRTSLFLADATQHTVITTYGTDEQGKTNDESDHIYDIETLDSELQHALQHTQELLYVTENAPLYTAGEVVGIGWNAFVILRDGDNLIGWVAIDNLIKSRPLLDHEQELLILYSGMLSNAILQKRKESSLKILHDSIIQLSHQETELDICRVAVSIIKEKLKLDRLAIFLSYDNGETIQGTFGTNVNGQITQETDYTASLDEDELLMLAINSPHQFAFESSVPLQHKGTVVGYGWNAAILLRNQDNIIGFLVLDNLLTKRPLSSHNKHLLTLFSSNLSEVISRKRAEESVIKLNNELESLVSKRTAQLALVNKELEQSNQKLAQLSRIDSLTNVANRRHFDETYQKQWSTACRHELNLSIIMLDVDYFKAYNDYYGHQQGDKCLKQIATLLNKHFRRAGELVARYGGEEFVILLAHTQVKQVNERIQSVINELFSENIEHIQSPLHRVTLSAGVSTSRINQFIFPNELLKRADEALYQAKSEGRNRFIIKKQEVIS